ncbi:MAG: rhomboid family intramembrane serine protease [Candidatus Alkaliphilus sp. MAG34]
MLAERLSILYRRSRVTFILLAIMIVYFVFITLNGGTTDVRALVKYGALYPPFILMYGEYYRFITAIFIHIGIMHIFFNGYALYIFGPQVERLLGPKKFLLFFLLTGAGGNLATFLFNFTSISAGASGSLFGIFGAFLYLIHRHSEMVTPGGKRQIFSLLLVNLTLTFLVPSISTTAHLGGLVMGYLLSYVFIR